MALWRIERQEVAQGTELPGTYDIKCHMRDTDTDDLEIHVVTMSRATYESNPEDLLAALVTAGYTPNDWGGV
jgi:hypothetical protein